MVAYVDSEASSTGAGTAISLSGTLPTGMDSSYFGLVVHSQGLGAGPANPPSGWTELASLNNGVNNNWFSVWARALSGADDGASVVVGHSANARMAFGLAVYSGVAGLGEVTTPAPNNVLTNTPTIDGLTTSEDNDMLVGLMASRIPSASNAITFTPPSGWDEREEVKTSVGGANNTGLYICDKLQAVAGASGNAVVQGSGALTVAPMKMMVALEPIVVAATGKFFEFL